MTILVAFLFSCSKLVEVLHVVFNVIEKCGSVFFVPGFCFVFELKRRQKTWLFLAMSLGVYLLNSKQADCL